MEKYFYVTQQGLNNLKDYEYRGKDRSILSPYLQVWWNKCITFFPLTIAPNMITLIGFIFIIFSFAIQIYFDPSLEGEIPNWVCLIHCFCLFVYQTMDAIDGKQARRTGTSSPLGELFDHGCDSITASLLLLTAIGTLQLGFGWFSYSLLIISLVAFYVAQLEEYYTGVLELGYFNVTEGQVCVMFLHLITGFVGQKFWANTLNIGIYQIEFRYFPGIISNIFVLYAIYENLSNIKTLCKGKSASMYNNLLPLLLTVIFSILWTLTSQNIFKYSLWYYLGIGLLVSNLVGRLVVARVCKVEYQSYQPIIIPLAFGLLNSILQEKLVPEKLYCEAMCALYVVMFLHLSWNIIQAFCEHLDIYCLTIKPKNHSIVKKK